MKKIHLGKLIFLLFICICSFSFLIRIYQVDKAPSGVFVDEASFGYNAYSILKTGKDEHGERFPLVFKAFGDLKLPAYTYAEVPFIKLLGLNNMSVRLPSVLAGTIFTGVFFLFLLEIGFTLPLSIIGALIATTSPWTIILSRFAFESNLGLLFFVLGFLFSFKAYRKKNMWYAGLSGVFFALTLYSYVSFKIITPLMIASFILIQLLIKKQKNFLWLIILISFTISIIPILASLFSTQTTTRFTQIGSTYNAGLKMEINENRAFCGKKLPAIVCYAASNKLLFNARTYFYRYIDILSPSYLFLEGDVEYPQINVSHFGVFYVWLLPFYLSGFFYLLKKMRYRTLTSSEIICIIGLVCCTLPTILVSGPQKVRLSALFPFLTIVIVFGIAQAEEILKKIIFKRIFFLILILLSFVSVGYFMVHFLTISINKYESAYGTYIPKLMKYLGEQDKKTQIYIQSIPEGIMYYAYINSISPSIYQTKVKRQKTDTIGFAHAKDLENIHITEGDKFAIACETKNRSENALFVTNENDLKISDSAKKIIYSENGVDSLATVYDLSKINYDYSICSKRD